MAKVRVYYKGLSDIREISAKHLKEAHGIEASADLVWDRLGKANGGVLKRPSLAVTIDAPDELIAILRNEGTFTISEVKDDGSDGDEIVKATLSDDTVHSATVVDASTGQRSTNPKAGG